MVVYRRFRYRIYPSDVQIARLRRWEDGLRFLWNLANEQRLLGLSRPQCERRYPTAFDQIKETKDLRGELPWLADLPAHACQRMLLDLERGWSMAFKKIKGRRLPRWKRKEQRMGITEQSPSGRGWRLDAEAGTLRFPKIGSIRIVLHRDTVGEERSCTIVSDGDQWFASILCKVDIDDPVDRFEPIVALDRGLVNIVADSDGVIIENPDHHERSLRRLARAQRAVSRKKKGSNNRAKARVRLARIYRKVFRQKDYVLHRISADYAKSHGTVVVESMGVTEMIEGARSRNLARGMSAVGWGRLVVMLRYKLPVAGGRVVDVDAAYSSQECVACGSVSAENRMTQAEFHCVRCGHVDHADVNAARVLLCRANRSALPAEGTAPEAARRNRKRLRSYVARRELPIAPAIDD